MGSTGQHFSWLGICFLSALDQCGASLKQSSPLSHMTRKGAGEGACTGVIVGLDNKVIAQL